MLRSEMALFHRVRPRVPVKRRSGHLAAEFAGNRSTFRRAADTMAGPCCFEVSFNTREPGVVIEARPMGMLWMLPAGWLSDLPGVASRTLESLPERYMTHRTNKFTLLDDAVRGFGGAAEEGSGGETDRRRWLAGLPESDGKRRRLFGVGEGPAEAVAGAKQDSVAIPEICVNFVSVATCKSLLAPLVTHLSTT
jgi:hypothetical protein